MQDIRVTYKRDLKVSVGSITIDAREGDISSLPRWLAKLLVEESAIEIQDNDSSAYISRALNRERISKPHDLSGIDLDFYIRTNDFIKRLKDKEKESIVVSLNSFVTSRIGKIVKLAAASALSVDLEKKLSAEEKELYNFIHNSSSEFKQRAVNKHE